MREAQDSELLKRARAGDAAAFDMLIRRHDKHLYRIARSVLADDHDAEDVVQESYIRAFTGLRDFRGAASLRTWLTRIVLNEANRDPERAAAHIQIRKTLEKAIDDLPAAFRVVFIMRDVEELGTADTAKHLGIREETVKTRLHRARRMLRESLGDQLASALKDVFPFEKPRCDALVKRLMDQLGFAGSMRLLRSL